MFQQHRRPKAPARSDPRRLSEPTTTSVASGARRQIMQEIDKIAASVLQDAQPHLRESVAELVSIVYATLPLLPDRYFARMLNAYRAPGQESAAHGVWSEITIAAIQGLREQTIEGEQELPEKPRPS